MRIKPKAAGAAAPEPVPILPTLPGSTPAHAPSTLPDKLFENSPSPAPVPVQTPQDAVCLRINNVNKRVTMDYRVATTKGRAS